MPRRHALELTTDEAGAAAVRRDWQGLRDAGLPSQLDHTGGTSTPHLKLLSAPRLGAEEESAAAETIGRLLRITARASGLAVLGDDRVTIARLLDVSDAVTASVLALRATTSGHPDRHWLAHVTLARRLPRADLRRALEVLDHVDLELTFTGLRRDHQRPDRDAVRYR